MSSTMSPASVPAPAPVAAPRSWLTAFLLNIAWTTVYALAVAGGVAVYGTVQVVRGVITPDDVAYYASTASGAWAWLTGGGATWLVGQFMRYAVPAFSEYNRRVAAERQSNLSTMISEASAAAVAAALAARGDVKNA